MAALTVIEFVEVDSDELNLWTSVTIPASYDHLLIRACLRANNVNEDCDLNMRMNGDTGSNYSNTSVYNYGGGPASNRNTGQTSVKFFQCCGNTATTDTFGALEIWIPNYANTTGYKSVFTRSAVEGATTATFDWRETIGASMWASTAAITTVSIFEGFYDLMEYSTITLYGVTGA